MSVLTFANWAIDTPSTTGISVDANNILVIPDTYTSLSLYTFAKTVISGVLVWRGDDGDGWHDPTTSHPTLPPTNFPNIVGVKFMSSTLTFGTFSFVDNVNFSIYFNFVPSITAGDITNTFANADIPSITMYTPINVPVGTNLNNWTAESGLVDTWDPAGGGAGAAGDPYVVTLSGQLYKMSNFAGFSRMLQGHYQGKLFTINAQTRFSTDEEIQNTKQYIENIMNKYEEEQPGSTKHLKPCDDNNTYFSRTHIQWGDEYIVVDMNDLTIVVNKSNFQLISDKEEPIIKQHTAMSLPEMNHYKCVTERAIKIALEGGLNIILSFSENPQIRGSFLVQNGHFIMSPQGALVHKMYERDIRLRKLNDLRTLKWSADRLQPKRVESEIYKNTKGNEYKKTIPVY